MASVTFRNGLTVDDSAGPAGLAGGGHRVRFVPSLSATVETALESKNWASLLGVQVFDGDYSSKEYAVGDLTVTGGSAKAWAIDSDSVTVDGVDYSARAHAIGTVIPSGSAKDWAVGTRTIGGLQSARIYADAASASALSALNAPGTTATSTTSNTIPTTFPATLTYTIQTGKTIVVGMFIIAASSASPANYAIGQVTSYNSGTGVLVLNVAAANQAGGSGTFASWSLSLAALANVAGAMTLAGPNTNTGQNTFTNATAPIITAKLGPTSAQQHVLPSVTSDTIVLAAATQTLTNKTLTAPVVSGGSINNTPIGATTPSTVAATTLTASGTANLQGNTTLGSGAGNSHMVNGSTRFTNSIAVGTSQTNGGLNISGNVIELAAETTIDTASAVDFHARAGSDFDARIIRNGGVNGKFDITQTGTAGIDLIHNGNTKWAVQPTGDVARVIPGGSTLYPDFACRAWVNFNGTNGAIRAAGNVSSVSRTAVGTYTVNFSSALPDDSYSAVPGCNDQDGGNGDSANVNSYTTTSFNMTTFIEGGGAALADKTFVNVTVNR